MSRTAAGSDLAESYDVVIVGGGVTGCATAYFLAAGGFDGSILVVERDPTYANAPSARAAGGVRQQFSTPENIRIGLFAADFVKNIDRHLSVDGDAPAVGFKERGYLILATADALGPMQENLALQRAIGANIAYRSNGELTARFPWLAIDGLAGGFLGLENEGWLDPYALLQGFRRKAVSLGVTLISDEVVDLRCRNRRVTAVELRSGASLTPGVVLNAAGARDATGMAARVGVDLPVEPRLRCAFVFECREQIGNTPQMILPNGVAFRAEGERYLAVVAPPPERDPATSAFEIDYALFDDIIWPTLAERVPAFAAIKLASAYACHYDFNTLDENVILGHVPMVDNFLVAAGFSGHGLMQSPAVGRALSELIRFGEYRTLDLSRFGYERVLSQSPLLETNCY
jgi:FAD-dependent oxidoreductase domain-containing protein 1